MLVVDFIHYCDFLGGILGGLPLLVKLSIDAERLLQFEDCGDFT